MAAKPFASSAALVAAPGAQPGEVWPVRPGAHVAVLGCPGPGDVRAALRRALGYSAGEQREEGCDGLLPTAG